MKIKTSELTGAALEWAVIYAKVLAVNDGAVVQARDLANTALRNGPDLDFEALLEREKICVMCPSTGDFWDARLHTIPPVYWRGPTPRIAAFRCFVANRLGSEVDVPDQLDIHVEVPVAGSVEQAHSRSRGEVQR